MAAGADDELFTEGLPAEQWWVLLEGAIALSRRTGQREQVVARMDVPGRWAGGFRAWDEAGTYLATGRGGHRRPGAAACRRSGCARSPTSGSRSAGT